MLIKIDAVTDQQFAAMVQASKRRDGQRWQGDTTAALECCDRGWMESRQMPDSAPGPDPGIFYVVTSPGAVVFGRERVRRM